MRLTIAFFFISIIGMNSQAFSQYFMTEEIGLNTIPAFEKANGEHLYKIEEKGGNNNRGPFSYPILLKNRHYDEKDTIGMIKELLKYEGDDRICVLPISCYNPAVSQLYLGKEKRYSIQIEALFIINQLYFQKPFIYSPYPVLFDKNSKKFITIKGKIISSIYNSYRSWFNKVKESGLSKARSESFLPLDQVPSIRWYQ